MFSNLLFWSPTLFLDINVNDMFDFKSLFLSFVLELPSSKLNMAAAIENPHFE